MVADEVGDHDGRRARDALRGREVSIGVLGLERREGGERKLLGEDELLKVERDLSSFLGDNIRRGMKKNEYRANSIISDEASSQVEQQHTKVTSTKTKANESKAETHLLTMYEHILPAPQRFINMVTRRLQMRPQILSFVIQHADLIPIEPLLLWHR